MEYRAEGEEPREHEKEWDPDEIGICCILSPYLLSLTLLLIHMCFFLWRSVDQSASCHSILFVILLCLSNISAWLLVNFLPHGWYFWKHAGESPWERECIEYQMSPLDYSTHEEGVNQSRSTLYHGPISATKLSSPSLPSTPPNDVPSHPSLHSCTWGESDEWDM